MGWEISETFARGKGNLEFINSDLMNCSYSQYQHIWVNCADQNFAMAMFSSICNMQENPCISFFLSTRSKTSGASWLSTEDILVVCNMSWPSVPSFAASKLKKENSSTMFSSFLRKSCQFPGKEFVASTCLMLELAFLGNWQCQTWSLNEVFPYWKLMVDMPDFHTQKNFQDHHHVFDKKCIVWKRVNSHSSWKIIDALSLTSL